MVLLDRDKLGHRLIKNLTTGTTRECGINRRTWNHNRNIGSLLWCGLSRHARFGIRLKVRRMIRRFIGVLKLRFGSVNLEKEDIRNFFH